MSFSSLLYYVCVCCVYLSDKLFEESADEGGDLVSVQQVERPLRVAVVIHYPVSITVV